MAGQEVPRRRLWGKQSVKPFKSTSSKARVKKAALKQPRGRRSKVQGPKLQARSHTTARASAVRGGLIPKARKAFALFVQERSSARKGAAKAEFAEDMKQMGRMWRTMAPEEKEPFEKRSLQEFKAQHAAMMHHGLHVRQKLPSCERPLVDGSSAPSQTTKLQIGPYTVLWIYVGISHVAVLFEIAPSFPFSETQIICAKVTDATVLGGGSYGKVLASMCPDGRMAAIKLFRKRDALDDARQEVSMHQKLSQLPASSQRWFAEMLHHDMHGEPFPWIAFSHEGASLCDVLRVHGPLVQGLVKPFALQLASALEALRSQAGLLHLDLKPGNILWSVELRQLRLIDFGLSEPFAKGGVVENPRFCEYVSLPYRPPELWHVGSDLRSLQSALGPKVDLWSFGCVLFEVCTGSMLMEPVDRRQKSPKQIIGDWCAHWQELQFLCRSKKEHNKTNHWLARLLQCHDWCLVVLALCHPLPKDRKLLKKMKGN